MTNLNAERTLLESTVHDAVGEIFDEQFEDIQNAIVSRVLRRLKMATISDANEKCESKSAEHKMFDPIAGP